MFNVRASALAFLVITSIGASVPSAMAQNSHTPVVSNISKASAKS